MAIFHTFNQFTQYMVEAFQVFLPTVPFSFVHFAYYSVLPEFFLLLLVCALIIVAVKKKESSQKSFVLSLPLFLNITTWFFIISGVYWLYLLSLMPSEVVTVFMFYQTFKISYTVILIKAIIAFLVAGTLLTTKRYLLLNNLVNYEYPLLISLASLGMYFALMANNWIMLFLTLELQALCFLVLFAWNRKNLRAITAALKFSLVNFVASILILLAIVFIIKYTQSFNIYHANPFFFFKSIAATVFQESSLNYDAHYIEWLKTQAQTLLHVYFGIDVHEGFWLDKSLAKQSLTAFAIYTLNMIQFVFKAKTLLLWDFIGFLLIIGFAIKLGLAPFGMWLQDLYTGVSLPVLNFFATAPKIVYMTLVSSLYINLFAYINGQHFLNMLLFLAVVSLVVANVAMFNVRNNVFQLLAWSSIANMGLLFFLLGYYPYQAFSLVFMIYYTFGTLLFFVILQFMVVTDATGQRRQPIYFTDFAVLRHRPNYRVLFIMMMVSLLNFFGIPPLVGFWMKFSVYKGVLMQLFYTDFSIMQWLFIITMLLITLIGSYNYLRLLYVLLSESNKTDLTLAYQPNTSKDMYIIAFTFVLVQVGMVLGYLYFMQNFNMSNLLMEYIISV